MAGGWGRQRPPARHALRALATWRPWLSCACLCRPPVCAVAFSKISRKVSYDAYALPLVLAGTKVRTQGLAGWQARTRSCVRLLAVASHRAADRHAPPPQAAMDSAPLGLTLTGSTPMPPVRVVFVDGTATTTLPTSCTLPAGGVASVRDGKAVGKLSTLVSYVTGSTATFDTTKKMITLDMSEATFTPVAGPMS